MNEQKQDFRFELRVIYGEWRGQLFTENGEWITYYKDNSIYKVCKAKDKLFKSADGKNYKYIEIWDKEKNVCINYTADDPFKLDGEYHDLLNRDMPPVLNVQNVQDAITELNGLSDSNFCSVEFKIQHKLNAVFKDDYYFNVSYRKDGNHFNVSVGGFGIGYITFKRHRGDYHYAYFGSHYDWTFTNLEFKMLNCYKTIDEAVNTQVRNAELKRVNEDRIKNLAKDLVLSWNIPVADCEAVLNYLGKGYNWDIKSAYKEKMKNEKN